jgi:arylsulfatase A-like enzyme
MNMYFSKFASPKLTVGGLFLSSLFYGCGEQKTTEPTANILWIIADDLGTDIGCYGEKAVMTPNLDNLASQGIKYTRFYSVTPVSSPSRSSLITGMYPCSIGCQQHRTYFKKPLPSGVSPVTYYFRKAGYFTSNGDYSNRKKPGKEDYNFVADSIFDGTDWSQRKEGQPFFAQIQIHYPHRAFEADSLCPVDPSAVTIPPIYPDHPLTRKDWALYLESVQHVDKIVGDILQRLEDEGLVNNTIVMFFGDQGQPHVKAKQFLYDFGTNTPLIIKFHDGRKQDTENDELVSNIDIAAACLKLAGIKIPETMDGRDFLTDDYIPRDMVFSQRDRMDGTVDRMRTLRTKEFRYIWNAYPERPYSQFNGYKKEQYPVLTLMHYMHSKGELNPVQELFFADKKPQEELYYIPDDPYQVNNLAGTEKYNSRLLEFRTAMQDWIKKYDKGIYPEPKMDVDTAVYEMNQNHEIRMKQMGLSPESSDEEVIQYWMKRYKIDNPDKNKSRLSVAY